MSDGDKLQPTNRFTGLAEVYAKYRPDYPKDAIDFIVDRGRLTQDALVADVGCGTGISSRLLAQRSIRVIGIEPNADMRRQAEHAAADLAVEFRDGSAEATGLVDRCADAVLAAQAFHWFDKEKALTEFHRILKPQGHVFLMWNELDRTDAFTSEYGKIIGATDHARQIEGSRMSAGTELLTHALFRNSEKRIFGHLQQADPDGLLGRAFSTSYTPRDPDGAKRVAEQLTDLFGRFERDGSVVLRYETSVFAAVRQE